MQSAVDIATSLVQRLVDSGYVAYFAGGWVRDHLLDRLSADIDIATSAPPERVMEIFPKTVPVGLRFGSVLVVSSGYGFEVTTFRSEHGYSDGRHPDSIEYSSAEEDAKRRSFTINGMFFDPLSGEVIDYVGGRRDLDLRIIRAIGDPDERFCEDKLRMVRAIRFAVKLKFQIEERTSKAIKRHSKELLLGVKAERLWREFEKIEAISDFADFLQLLNEYGLLAPVLPQLEGLQQEEVAKLIDPLKCFPKETPLILRLMQLFVNFPLSERQSVCDLLRTSNDDRKLVEEQSELDCLIRAADSPVEWAHFYAKKSADLLIRIAACRLPEAEGASFLQRHASEQRRLEAHIERIRRRTPLVTAAHLKVAGIKPGPRMGQLLAEAEAVAIQCDLHRPEDVLSRLGLSSTKG